MPFDQFEEFTPEQTVPSSNSLTRKQKRRERRNQKRSDHQTPQSMFLHDIRPRTATQGDVFRSWYDNKHIVMCGSAGTGKTFVGMYLSLSDVLSKNDFKKLVIVRSAVQGRNQGFMPGNQKEKARVYEDPYVDVCQELFGRGDAYEILKSKGNIVFTTTSFLRSVTFRDSIVLVDEFQNMTGVELHTVITRLGDNSRLIMCGDAKQNDLENYRGQESGLADVMRVMKEMQSVDVHEFTAADVVRSGFVREYILTKERLEETF